MVVMGSFMTFAGVLGYKYFFFKSSWRKIYLWSIIITTFFSFLQLLLIFQVSASFSLMLTPSLLLSVRSTPNTFTSAITFSPWGMTSSQPTSVASSSFRCRYHSSPSFLLSLLFLDLYWPVDVYHVHETLSRGCGRSELLHADNLQQHRWHLLKQSRQSLRWNLVSPLPSPLFSPGTFLLRDVSNNAMKAHDISGFWRLHILTSGIALFPLLLLSWLPQNEEEQDKLRKSPQRSKVGGAIFLIVLVASLLWSIIASGQKLFFR
jgi:hypothetical protein